MPLVHQLPLDERAVAAAPGADPAVAPLLAGRPGERVVSVDAVLAPGLELALRLVPAAHVRDDGGVAALREPDAPADEALARRLVRRPLVDRRVRAARERQVDVGRERDAVAHRHPLVVQQPNVPQAHPTSGGSIDEVSGKGVPAKWHAAPWLAP